MSNANHKYACYCLESHKITLKKPIQT